MVTGKSRHTQDVILFEVETGRSSYTQVQGQSVKMPCGILVLYLNPKSVVCPQLGILIIPLDFDVAVCEIYIAHGPAWPLRFSVI